MPSHTTKYIGIATFSGQTKAGKTFAVTLISDPFLLYMS
jgi:hypothetical protein